MAFNGKVALITGGGSGMGRTAAQILAKQGASVAIFDVNEGSPLTTAAVSNESPGYNQNLLATGSEDGKVVVTR